MGKASNRVMCFPRSCVITLGVSNQTITGLQPAWRHSSKVIAVIDDNESMQDSLSDLIESGGFEARCFGSAKAFLESDLHRRAACLIVDIRMPKMSGLELQARLKKEECNVPIIFITAFDDAEMRAQAIKEGAVEFLAKPFDHQLLLKMLGDTLTGEAYVVHPPRFAIAS
jgi:FixJ family two-component response regulator